MEVIRLTTMNEDLWVGWSYGQGGWVQFVGSDWPGPIYVRFVERDGRLAVAELYLDGRGTPIRSTDLRHLDVSRLEAMAASEWEHKGKPWVNEPGPDLSRLASYFGRHLATWDAEHWVAQSFWAQLKGSGVEQAPMAQPPKRPPHFGAPRPPLRAPTHGLTDDFLREVAAAYNAAVRRRLRPAPTLAEEAGVDHRTVHSWVAKARRRGIMPPGSRGKVG